MRNIKEDKKNVYSLIGFESPQDNNVFSHRPYFTKVYHDIYFLVSLLINGPNSQNCGAHQDQSFTSMIVSLLFIKMILLFVR